jgi:hypothetical protein
VSWGRTYRVTVACPRPVSEDDRCDGPITVDVMYDPGSRECPPSTEIEVSGCAACGAEEYTDDELDIIYERMDNAPLPDDGPTEPEDRYDR